MGHGPTTKKKSGQRFFFLFFQSSAYFTVYIGGRMVLLQRKPYFPKDPEGVLHFPGGGGGVPTFSRGGRDVQMLSSIETHITCDFPGGVRTPCPLDQHMYCNYMLTTELLMLILSIKIGDELSSQNFEPDKC